MIVTLEPGEASVGPGEELRITVVQAVYRDGTFQRIAKATERVITYDDMVRGNAQAERDRRFNRWMLNALLSLFFGALLLAVMVLTVGDWLKNLPFSDWWLVPAFYAIGMGVSQPFIRRLLR